MIQCQLSNQPVHMVQRKALSSIARQVARGRQFATSAADAASSSYLVSLERSVGERMGSDKALWQTGSFGAAVYPDLPIATTWEGLFKALSK